uniref:CID domain-containing protein n=1 Tax=Strigamia maritima TaxID=126957 RepID=T1J1R3_STRMM
MADVFCEEYASSLNDLTCNSKPHISVLTMLAEENSQYAPNVVRLIEQHLQKVRPEIKLPAIYLIDSIVKNVDEKTRLQLYKLRQTWAEVFPNKKLYAIDMRVHQMDPAWPISAPTANQSIHVNPKFLKSPKEEETASVKANQEIEEAEMRRQLIAKQQELLKLQQQKLELELLQAKNRLEEQKRLLQTQPTEVEQTVQETNKLFEVNKPVASSSSISQVHANSIILKDPRSAKGPRQIKEQKPFRIPNLSSAVTKPVNNIVGGKLDGQIKSEVKQIVSGVRNMSDLAAGTFFAKQTLVAKDHGARNDLTKALKKKDSELPTKVSSKKKTEREWKKSKNELNELKKIVGAPSPNKKSPDVKKRKEKSKKDNRDASKVRKGERKVNAKKKNTTPTKRSNRDRSESPEPKLEQVATSPKSEQGVSDKRSDKDGGKYKKKLGDVVVVGGVDESKENKIDSGEVLIADVDLRKVRRDVVNDDGEEPPSKRVRRDDDKDKDPRITNLFGSKDQDYRQQNSQSQNEKNQMRNDRNSWAQYKAEHPDEFKNSPFPPRGNRPDFVPYRSYDMDLRMPRDLGPDCASSEGGLLNAPPGMRGARGRSNDPRLVRRGFGRPMRQGNMNNRMFDDRNLRRHPLYQRYQMEFENAHPSDEIPNALQLDKQGDIMRQADQQLKCGLLTREQHHELLNQLAKLYELQVTRQRQREEQLRERIMSNRPSMDESFAAPETNSEPVATTTTTTPPLSEPETGARTKVSMLSIFQRENAGAGAAAADAANPNRTAAPADDGDRLIAIDGKIMKLKYHDGTAIILEGSKVQEILFRGTRREIFVDRDIVLLGFEGDEQTFFLNNKPHTLKFGTPTHEIYVDKIPYEARFGGPPIRLMLDGEVHEIRMGGPPPDVELKELGAEMKARIAHLIDEPKAVVAVVDDVKEKTDDERSKEDHQQIPMEIDELNEGEGSIVTNVEVDKTKVEPKKETEVEVEVEVEVEEKAEIAARVSPDRPWEKEREPHRVYDKDNEQFASSSFKGRDKWREREKPTRNVREYNERDDYWPRRDDEFARRPKYFNSNSNSNSNNNNNNTSNNNNNRERGGRNGSPQRGMGEYGRFRDGPRRNFNPMYFAEGPRMRYDGARAPYDNRPRGYDGGHPRFDMRLRADLRHSGMRQPLLGQQYYGTGQFNLDQAAAATGFRTKMCDAPGAPPTQSLPFAVQAQTGAAAAPSLDMSELFQKLVANGIIPSTAATDTTQDTNKAEHVVPEEPEQLAEDEEEEYFEEYDEKVPIIEFTSESLRTRHPAIIGKLCRGIQCSSCGLRFTSEQTEKYGQHLDWHFRQNRRERDSAKKAMSRKWYYDVQDWIQFEEIEDTEERARSLFEEQANEDQAEQTEDVQTIPVAEDDGDNVCAVCGESFEQFWDQDKEEWHLKDATRIDGKTYHPICYEDIRNISQADISVEDVKVEPKPIADSWKSLEENESKLKRAMQEEKEKEEKEKEKEKENVEIGAKDEEEVAAVVGKASVDDIGQEEDKELCIKEELIDNRMESISSHSIDDDDNVELDVKLNEDKRNVDENLVCPVKTEVVVESVAPTSRPVESQDEDGEDGDGMVEYVAPKLPGFTILPPVMRGTELSGLCSIM